MLKRLAPFFYAVGFLTRLPVPRLSKSEEDWRRSAAYYPAVGLLLGLLVAGASRLAVFLFPFPLAAVLTVLCWAYLTGGLHLDGWMDLADGLGSQRSREKMLEIMKDSRVGAMGVLAAVFLLLVKAAAVEGILAGHMTRWLILPPLAARLALAAAIRFWPYISEKGIGAGLRQGLTPVRLWLGLLFTAGTVWLALGLQGAVTLAAALFSGWLLIRYLSKRLGGLTGDCYGAVVEWTETAALLLILLSGRWFS